MPIRILEINHVALIVSNFERSLQFYTKALNLTRKPRPNFGDTGGWFQIAPGQELHIIESSQKPKIPNDAPTHFALVVENQSEAIAHLAAHDIEYSEPKSRPDGAIQIFVRDPDNHLIELTCNLPDSPPVG